MRTDTLFYRLFQAYPALALEAAGIVVDDPQGYQFCSEEVKETAFRLDGVLIPPPTTPQAPLVFLEAQMQGNNEFYGRFWAEVFLYLYRRAEPDQTWRAIVIYPNRATERPDARYTPLFALPAVYRVYLDDLAKYPGQSVGLQLLRLLVAEPAEVRLQAQRLAQQAHTNPAALPLPLSALMNLLETILVYRLPALTHVEIQAMLGLTHADLKQSRFYQEVFQEGQKEGLEKGLEKGRETGRREESISMILRLLQRRLGALSSAQEEQIRRLSLTQLETLAEALLDFQTPKDLAEWLNQWQ